MCFNFTETVAPVHHYSYLQKMWHQCITNHFLDDADKLDMAAFQLCHLIVHA